MAIEESCPQCGGTARVLLSPGLCRCANVITWSEPGQVTEYVTQDDPAMFYNFGLRGTKQVPVTKWVNTPKSRVCGHVYELDAPMTTLPCGYLPGGKACGAFAVGLCSDCQTDVCRYHGSYVDGRLLCDTCKSSILAARQQEAEAIAAAERERTAEEKRKADAEAAERAAQQVAAQAARATRNADADAKIAAFLRAAVAAGCPRATMIYRRPLRGRDKKYGRGWQVFTYDRQYLKYGEIAGYSPCPVYLLENGEWCTVHPPITRATDYLLNPSFLFHPSLGHTTVGEVLTRRAGESFLDLPESRRRHIEVAKMVEQHLGQLAQFIGVSLA